MRRTKFRFLLLLGVFAVLMALPVAAQAQGNAVVANAYRLNLRTGPSVNYSIITQLVRGQQLTLVGRNADASWVQVNVTYTGLNGWVNSRYVSTYVNLFTLPVTSPGGPTPPITGTATVTAYYLNLRNGPGAHFSILAVLSRGQGLSLVGRNLDSSWAQVSVLGSGAGGWVSTRYIAATIPIASLPITSNTTPNPPGPPAPNPQSGVVANAYFLNVRYGPSVGYHVAFVVARGAHLRLIQRNSAGTWVLVQFSNGSTGWVNARYVATSYPIFSLPIAPGF